MSSSSDRWALLLRAGASEFNAARATAAVDLRGANLDDVQFGDADLSNADLSRASLRRADFSGSTLRHVDLTGAQLDQASFERTTFEKCALDEASAVHTRFTHAALRSLNVRGARFDEASFEGARFADVTFTACSLADTRFIGAAPRIVNAANTRSRLVLAPAPFANVHDEIGEDGRECPACWEMSVVPIDVDWPPAAVGVEPQVRFACAACRRDLSSVGLNNPLSIARRIPERSVADAPIIRLPICTKCGSPWVKADAIRPRRYLELGVGSAEYLEVTYRCLPCGEQFQPPWVADRPRPAPPIDLDESWTAISGVISETRFVELARSACARLDPRFETPLAGSQLPGRDVEETLTLYGSAAAGLHVLAWHTRLAIDAIGLPVGSAFALTVAGEDRVVRLRVRGPGAQAQEVRELIQRRVG